MLLGDDQPAADEGFAGALAGGHVEPAGVWLEAGEDLLGLRREGGPGPLGGGRSERGQQERSQDKRREQA
jgi:hypothetical protein